MSELVESLARAIKDRTTLPPMPANLTLNDAYAMQAKLVRAVAGDAIAGYKAGLTAPAGQAQFGIDHPLIGALYESGRLQSGASFASGPGVSLECEIGLVIDADGAPRTAGPVIEVPRAAFASSADANGINMVACNIAADRFITGEQGELRDDYEDLEVTLTRDGETVTHATLKEALGGPLPALKWMTSLARELGAAAGRRNVDDHRRSRRNPSGAAGRICGGLRLARQDHVYGDLVAAAASPRDGRLACPSSARQTSAGRRSACTTRRRSNSPSTDWRCGWRLIYRMRARSWYE